VRAIIPRQHSMASCCSPTAATSLGKAAQLGGGSWAGKVVAETLACLNEALAAANTSASPADEGRQLFDLKQPTRVAKTSELGVHAFAQPVLLTNPS
jgi:hypothetical protein